ncbi:hypothetical protein Tsubulata_039458 [Turnera subulata]|uniref:DUF4283 domain-containing protein n=1 Tax=Turnera subulata TaxID=218843 RepID=A0A9Q0JCF3_9ROSI|nr:hypothetical protein Tsubulata_039458 [Turnera subulata]
MSEGCSFRKIVGLVSSSLKQEVEIKFLGGFYVILKLSSREAMLECLNSCEFRKRGYFDLLKEWELEDCASHRLGWINIHGVPPAAWCSDFFSQVAIRFGQFIRCHNELESSSDLSMARVLVLTTYKNPLSRSFEVAVGSKIFNAFAVDAPVTGSLDFEIHTGVRMCSNQTLGYELHSKDGSWACSSVGHSSKSMKSGAEKSSKLVKSGAEMAGDRSPGKK